tara:strand:+ start:1778 stop:2179 length:402 start_codon:yes stop_codon:yes gene_type:complete
MAFYGPRWPLKRGNHDTYQIYTEFKSQINFYLKTLLLTAPGENISSPTYGVGLRRYLFEQNTEEVHSVIRTAIYDQIGSFMSYLRVKSVRVTASNEEIDTNSLKISITYSIPKKAQNEIFELTLNQTENIGFY